MKNAEQQRELTERERKDLRVLCRFTHIYCRAHHAEGLEPIDRTKTSFPEIGLQGEAFCAECREFLLYAVTRRLRCPLDPKPKCKDCHVHCYRPGHRERVREIMRFSGKYMIRRGRLDLLWHYFF